MFSFTHAFHQTLFFQNRDVVGLDRRSGFAERSGEIIVGLRAGGELLEDECPGFISVQNVYALVVGETSLKFLALLRVEGVDA